MATASTIQQQFLFLERMQPGNSAYNMPTLFHIQGVLNAEVLKSNLSEIAHRHEILRTTFAEKGGIFHPIVHDDLPLDFQTELLPNTGQDNAALLDRIERAIKCAFNFDRAPLWRTRIFRLSDNECYLLFVMHHTLTDLRSKTLFSTELKLLYNAKIAQESSSPVLPVICQYSEYSQWEEQFIGSDAFNKMVAFWTNETLGVNQTIDLSTDYPRPTFLKLEGAATELFIDADSMTSVRQFCSENQIPTFLFLLTAYAVLLHRYTGKQDFMIGIPFTNRRNGNHKEAMGSFVNMLPIPVRFDEEMTFADCLKRIRKTMLLAHRNQEITLKSIISATNPARTLSHNPLFQTGFTFEPPMQLALNGAECTPIKVHNHGAQLDLHASLWEADDTLSGFIEYNTSLFKKETIQRLVDNYKAVVLSAITVWQQPLSQLEILSVTERDRILRAFNTPCVNVNEYWPVPHALEAWAKKAPDRIAAVGKGRQISYQQLNAKANQLARHLTTPGPIQGQAIGIYMDRSIEELIAILAVLKAGATYVPIDPMFPEERINYMIEQSRISTILTEQSVSALLKQNGLQITCVNESQPLIEKESASNLDLEIAPDALAYIIHTSGSTGRPKGVKIPHGALSNFLQSMAIEPGMTDQDSLLAVTTLSFDIAMLELLLPLTVGAKVVIASNETAMSGALLLEAIQTHQITILQGTPVTWRMLIDAGWQKQIPLKVLCGGEAMPRDLAEALLERSDEVWNMYGPTETTIWSTCHRLTTAEGPILVGKPIANTTIYVLNDHLRPVPIGVPGHLYIGGKGLAQGYQNNSEETARSYISSPPELGSSSLIYKTGDIAKFHDNGDLEIMGRSDHQVKLRGYRIELGEIETQLSKHPDIKASVVVAMEREPGIKTLVAFYTLNGTIEPVISQLRLYLGQTLPDYMIPSYYTPLATMPLTPNGKINRRALPRPEFKRPNLGHDYVAPAAGPEAEIAGLWGKILRIDPVGINDAFFEIGGNSLLAVKFLTEFKSEYNYDISLLTLFQYPTIRSLANHIAQNEDRSDAPPSGTNNRAMQRQNALNAIRQRRSR
jgi:amino acid adenylation domain-containing protein